VPIALQYERPAIRMPHALGDPLWSVAGTAHKRNRRVSRLVKAEGVIAGGFRGRLPHLIAEAVPVPLLLFPVRNEERRPAIQARSCSFGSRASCCVSGIDFGPPTRPSSRLTATSSGRPPVDLVGGALGTVRSSRPTQKIRRQITDPARRLGWHDAPRDVHVVPLNMHFRDHPPATVPRRHEIANRRRILQEADFRERREAKNDLYEIVERQVVSKRSPVA